MTARLQLLRKLAQQASAPQTTANDTQTTPQTVSTTPTTTPPPAFSASQTWGWLVEVLNPITINALNSLISTLNIALHYASNGKLNWLELHNDGFQVDPSGTPSIDAKNLLNVSILVYRTYINSGNKPPQPFTSAQIKAFNQQIANSQAFLNLAQLNPTGAVAQRIPGGLKDTILNILRYIDSANR